MINNNSNPRKPTKSEWDELIDCELAELQKIRRLYGHCAYDEGDLDFMLRQASVVVFDEYNSYFPAPGFYTGRIMVVVRNIRNISTFVWKNGKLVAVNEDNRAEFK